MIVVQQAFISVASEYKLFKTDAFITFLFRLSDPPLVEKDIPIGIWLCHTCRGTGHSVPAAPTKTGSIDRLHSVAAASSSTDCHTSDHSRPNSPAPGIMNELDADVAAATFGMSILPSDKVRSLRQQRGLRMSVSSDTSQSDRVSIKAALKNNTLLAQQHQTAAKEPLSLDVSSTTVESKASKSSGPLTPMDELIRAAALMNPRQFELPREMSIFVQFPGTDRSNAL